MEYLFTMCICNWVRRQLGLLPVKFVYTFSYRVTAFKNANGRHTYVLTYIRTLLSAERIYQPLSLSFPMFRAWVNNSGFGQFNIYYTYQITIITSPLSYGMHACIAMIMCALNAQFVITCLPQFHNTVIILHTELLFNINLYQNYLNK